jgi:nucleoside-diphosphate-sugar epimerase
MARYAAVVLGATGMVGRSLTEALALHPDWEVVAVARRPLDIKGVNFVSVDIASQADARQRLGEFGNTTHIFYAARSEHPEGEPESADRNFLMLRNVVEAIAPRAARLQHIHLVEGTKWYGSNSGPFRTPAREDDPRAVPANFVDLVCEQATRHLPRRGGYAAQHRACHRRVRSDLPGNGPAAELSRNARQL